MKCFTVKLEAHCHAAAVYMTGSLGELAAARMMTLLREMPGEVRVVRLDLRAVHYIDPCAFVRVARTLNTWRDAGPRRGRRVTIEFPARSAPSRPAVTRPVLYGQTATAVSIASLAGG